MMWTRSLKLRRKLGDRKAWSKRALKGGSFALVERRERPRRVRTLEEAEVQETVRVTRRFFPPVGGPVPTSILTQLLRGFAEGNKGLADLARGCFATLSATETQEEIPALAIEYKEAM